MTQSVQYLCRRGADGELLQRVQDHLVRGRLVQQQKQVGGQDEYQVAQQLGETQLPADPLLFHRPAAHRLLDFTL